MKIGMRLFIPLPPENDPADARRWPVKDPARSLGGLPPTIDAAGAHRRPAEDPAQVHQPASNPTDIRPRPVGH